MRYLEPSAIILLFQQKEVAVFKLSSEQQVEEIELMIKRDYRATVDRPLLRKTQAD
jgi:hypothetical protein